jgi:hypothetical protein
MLAHRFPVNHCETEISQHLFEWYGIVMPKPFIGGCNRATVPVGHRFIVEGRGPKRGGNRIDDGFQKTDRAGELGFRQLVDQFVGMLPTRSHRLILAQNARGTEGPETDPLWARYELGQFRPITILGLT